MEENSCHLQGKRRSTETSATVSIVKCLHVMFAIATHYHRPQSQIRPIS